MSGYNYNQGMSNNAVEAYFKNQMPKSKWNKKTILTEIQNQLNDMVKYLNYDIDTEKILAIFQKEKLVKLQEILSKCGYHHTGKYYNTTDFYEITDSDIIDYLNYNCNIELNKKRAGI